VGGTQGEPVCEPGFPDTGFTSAIVRSLSPGGSHRGTEGWCRTAQAASRPRQVCQPSCRLLTVALWAHLSCADLSVERHTVTYYRLCWTISPV
jgi:hypothetical protein